MPPYEQYRSARSKWIDEIPTHWAQEKLKFVAHNRASHVDKHSLDGEITVLLCNYTDVYHNERITEDLPFMQATATEQEINLFSLRAGDVLITKDSESWDDIAIPAYVPKIISGVLCGYHLSLIRPDQEKFVGGFLYYLLSSTTINRQFQLSANGVTRFGLSAHCIDNAELIIPPLPEQRSIAAFLDERTAKIDALIANKERLLALLAEKRQAIITRAVTKGLDPAAPMKDTGIPWLGEIPAHWEVKRLDLLNNSLRPVMYGIVLPGPHFEGGVPIIKGGDVKADRLQPDHLSRTDPEIDAKHARSRVRPGDIVYAIRGGVGDVELVPRELQGANLTQDAARVSPAENVDASWLLFALRSTSTFEQAVAGTLGATIRGLNIRNLKKILLPVPPISERQEIATFLHAKDNAISIGCSLVRRHLDILQEHRSALITSAVTGRIDISKCR